MKRKIDPKKISKGDLHQLMIGSIAPRPIAFVSTVDNVGVANLAPYSFFNAFSSNPPIVIFSANLKGEEAVAKDTLRNVRVNGEVVINLVSFDIVRQMALSSVEFPHGVSEFDKVGLTPVQADIVKPPLVAESPINLECKVREVISLGEQGGAGQLVICDVVLIHIKTDILGKKERIDPKKADLVGRLGRTYYTRASGDALFSIYQNTKKEVIGYDRLPESVQKSYVLTGNQIAEMAALATWPDEDMIRRGQLVPAAEKELRAQDLITKGKVAQALALFL